MVEAIVGVALRAILASIVLGAGLGLAVFGATRLLALTASTRHALWTLALLAIALMPIAGVGVSIARGLAAQEPPAIAAFRLDTIRLHVSAAHVRHEPTHAASPATAAGTSGSPAAGALVPGARAGWRLFSAWQPRLPRTIALGLIAIWIGGAGIGLIGLLLSVMRVRGLKKRSSPLEGALADELPWLTEIGPGREIYLRLSFEIETPVAIGFGRPVILIPTELASVDGLTGIEPLVLHEYAHLRRYDDWTNLVQRIIERIFWFNPILWIVGRRIALEREIASDDAVVAKTGAAHEYATSLWRLAREMRMPEHAVVAPGALLTRKQISVRIEQLLDKNRGRLHRSPAAALGVVLAGLAAVAFVGSSAPAVELPAAAIAAKTAPHQAAAVAAHARRSARAVADSTVADPLTDLKIAEIESRYEPAASASAAPASAPPASAAPMTPMPSPPVLAMPHAHAVPTPVIRLSVNGHDVSSTVREALRSIPTMIAQEAARSAPPRYHRAPGAVVTREVLAACTACSLRGADLHGQDLHGLTLNGTDLTAADLRGANLSGARLTGVTLRLANLSGADLRGASLTGVELRGANLDNAQLDEIRVSGVSVRGVSLHGTILRSLVASCSGCDFSHMDLHGQDLHGLTLSGADFSGADLRDANLSGVNFTGVDLSRANLSGADLTGAALSGCDLRGTNRTGIRTTGLRLSGSDID